MSNHGGRKLFGAPILLQDWDQENEKGDATQYWELFLDLLLVAAASALADQFKNDQDFFGFVVYFLILINSWNLYTHHITTRFVGTYFTFMFVIVCWRVI